jgi:hypothetical protein
MTDGRPASSGTCTLVLNALTKHCAALLPAPFLDSKSSIHTLIVGYADVTAEGAPNTTPELCVTCSGSSCAGACTKAAAAATAAQADSKSAAGGATSALSMRCPKVKQTIESALDGSDRLDFVERWANLRAIDPDCTLASLLRCPCARVSFRLTCVVLQVNVCG